MICVYIGCSTHSVPSWSKVAIRASGATNFGLALSVVTCTNSTIAFFAGPSFQDGSGSVGPRPGPREGRGRRSARPAIWGVFLLVSSNVRLAAASPFSFSALTFG